MLDIKNVKLHNIEDSLVNSKLLYAHIDDDGIKKPELIIEHSERTIESFYRLCRYRGVDKVLNNIIYNLKFEGEKIFEDTGDLILELFINAVYLHDMGKMNPAFQFIKMKNYKIQFDNTSDTSDSNHSMLSAIIFIDIFNNKINAIKGRGIKNFLRHVLLCFAQIISRHHTYLTDFQDEDFLQDIKDYQERLQESSGYLRYYKYSNRLLEELKLNLFNNAIRDGHDGYEFFVLTKLLFSAIVSCDFYATSEYDTGIKAEFKNIEYTEKIMEVYKSTGIYKGIEAYKQDKNFFGKNSINTMRSEMFLEAEENLLKNIDKCNIFYLEAPTGSGKTNTSINLALNIAKHCTDYNKISYIFPFNTLVEQTKNTFDKTFNEEVQKNFRVAVINSIVPIVTETERDENEKIDYKRDYLNRQMLQYPVTLTTHVNFFNYLFGTGREINLPLIHLCNSIVIMDEIQSYRNIIWPKIIKFLNTYSKLLNIKIIIMSATLPKLDKLLKDGETGFCELIEDTEKYYQNPLFKNRVKLNFELLGKKKTSEEELLSKIDEVIKERQNVRLLIEFISKTTARKFFDKLKIKYPNKQVDEITGDDSNYIRKKILDKINSKDKDGKFLYDDVILVATQVIEAGVDIDMDVGFKDISLFDGEEQFLGRINRSCKKENCQAFFFNMDSAGNIYKGDLRLEFDLTDKSYQEYLINKNFKEFYDNCFRRLDEKMAQNNVCNMKNFDEAVLYLNFEKISNEMKLITDENYQLFLAHDIKNEETGEIINGSIIWEQYKELVNNNKMDYSEKKIKLSKLSEKMAYFTYNYIDNSSKSDKTPKMSSENIGRIYYIENGSDYITEDGKFNRRKYQEDSGGGFL